MKKIQFDTIQLDQLKIVEDSNCCLKVNAVITKEGIYKYPDGRAYKSRMELLKATPYARAGKITILDHPDTLVVMSQKQMYGTVEKPFMDRNRIRATLNFDKALCPQDFLNNVRLAAMKIGPPLDVSIGFYYQPDAVPGTWEGQPYDYVMRDILIDHVAVGVPQGKCTAPDCGIGVDAVMRRIGNDPFAGYEDFADCVAKNRDKQNPEAYCGEIKRKAEGSSQAQIKGGKPQTHKKKIDYGASTLTNEEIEAAFNQCVAERVAEGMERQQAEVYCLAATKPSDEPQPPESAAPPAYPPSSTDKRTPKIPANLDEDYPWDECISDQQAAGYSEEQAKRICASIKNRTVSHASIYQKIPDLREAAKFVLAKAEKDKVFAYNLDKSIALFDIPEPTPMEKCVKAQVEAGKTQEEAEAWCREELGGEHQPTETILEQGDRLMLLKKQRDIEKVRRQRRRPV